MQINSVQHDKGPFPGYTQFNNSAGKPITVIGDTSGAGTTFTATTVTDAAAWDLSAIAAGMVAKTSGEWYGLITAVDDGNDTLTVEKWEYRGNQGDKRAVALPAAGETVTIHRVHKCARLTLYGGITAVYFAKNPTPASPNWVTLFTAATEQTSKLILETKMGNSMNLTEWYGITASGNGDVYWVAE